MSGGVYVLFADSTQQSWNQPKTITKSTREKDMTDINDTKKTSDNHLVAWKKNIFILNKCLQFFIEKFWGIFQMNSKSIILFVFKLYKILEKCNSVLYNKFC